VYVSSKVAFLIVVATRLSQHNFPQQTDATLRHPTFSFVSIPISPPQYHNNTTAVAPWSIRIRPF
jgi:hypothetical protein